MKDDQISRFDRYTKQQCFDAAFDVCAEAIRDDGTDWNAIYLAGICLRFQGDSGGAIGYYQRALALEICGLLTDALGEMATRVSGRNVILSEMIVWQREIEALRKTSTKGWAKDIILKPIDIPLTDLLGELYRVRMVQMALDFDKGGLMLMQRGPGTLALLEPISSTFIAQVTGNEAMAADGDEIVAIAVRLNIRWVIFWEATKLALR